MHICVQKQVEKRKERFANWSSEFSLNNLDQEFSLDDKGLQPGVAAQPCESFRRSLKRYKEHITAPNLPQPASDTHLNGLQNQPRKKLLPALWHQTSMQSQFLHPVHHPSSRHCSHWALRVLDHWRQSHEAPRKRHRISLRQPYTPRSVHCHSSLHLQCRRKMQRHTHPWALQHSSKGISNGKMQRLTWQHPPTPHSCIRNHRPHHTQRYCYLQTYALLCRKFQHICKFLGSIPSYQLQCAWVPFWNNIQTPLPKHTWDMHINAIWNMKYWRQKMPQCLQQNWLAKDIPEAKWEFNCIYRSLPLCT